MAGPHPSRLGSGLALVASALGCLGPARAAPVAAGTRISNTATLDFSEGGPTRRIGSNAVELVVGELLDCHAQAAAAPVEWERSEAIAPFRVENRGNGPEALQLSAALGADGGAGPGTITGIALDSDGNGRFDAQTDTMLAAGEPTPEIQPADAMTVFVRIAAAMPSIPLRVTLAVACATGSGQPGTTIGGAGAGGSDAIVGAAGARGLVTLDVDAFRSAMSVVKSAVIEDPYGGNLPISGARIRYHMVVSVDPGRTVEGVMLNDPIPDGTTYLAQSLEIDGQRMTDAPGDDAGDSDGTRVAVALPGITPSVPRMVSFAVVIK